MPDDSKHQERLQQKSRPAGHASASPNKEAEAEAGEAACGAFGYLRGLRDQSAALELRFRDGNSTWFPYTWMGNWQYNPSDGLAAEIHRGPGVPRPDPGQQPRPAAE